MKNGLVRNILHNLDKPSTNIAIVEIKEILSEFNSIFEFLDDLQKKSPTGIFYDMEFLPPNELDEGSERKIVLMSDPSKIFEYKVTGERIYIIENINNLKSANKKYIISNKSKGE